MSEAAVGDLRESLDRLGLKPDQQLALLPESGDEAEAAITANATRAASGRPPGASNRATRQLRNYILANFTDPAIGLAATGLASTAQASVLKALALARALRCKPIEAMDLMRRCSDGLMRYVHSPQPLAVQLSGKVAQLHIGLGAGAAGEGARLGGAGLAELLDAFGRPDDALALADLADDGDDEENADVSIP